MKRVVLLILLLAVLMGCSQDKQRAESIAAPAPTPEPEPTLAPTVPQQVTPADTTPGHSPETVVIQPPQGSDSHNVSDNDSTAEVKPIRPVVYARPSYNGPTSMEERIADADLIFIGRLSTVANTVEEYNFEGRTGYTGAMRFTFNVGEVLKSPPGFTAPQRIVALVGALDELDTRAQATALSQWLLSNRDTQWDDRDALIFLTKHTLTFPATNAADLYFLSITDDEHGFGDHFSIASKWNKVWLPEAQAGSPTAGQNASASERWFLTDVPQSQGGSANQVESPSIALTNLKAEISRISAKQGTDTSIQHRYCITRRNLRERTKAYYAAQGKAYYASSPSQYNVEVGSGLPAGTVVFESDKAVYGEGWETKLEYLGDDAGLFVQGEMTVHYTMKYDLQFSSLAVLKTINLKAGSEPLLTVRPLPSGVYELTSNFWSVEFLSCDTYVSSKPLIVTVNAPSGTLHEAFFDPVTVGTAIGADSTNGVLKPTAFTDGNSASATLQRIAWEAPSTGSGQAGAVKLKLTPHTGLANHVVDFIALDGKVILSLDAADATVDAASNTLSWSVSSQPWEDGDMLMLRIHYGPVTSVPTPAGR